MFDRFIRLARAKKALREGRYADALQVASDPMIAADRRAEVVRTRATTALAEQARRRLGAGDLTAARADLRRLQRAGATATDLQLAVDAAAADNAARAGAARDAAGELRRLLQGGELNAAETLLATLRAGPSAVDPTPFAARLNQLRSEAAELAELALRDLVPDRVLAAIDTYLRALAIDGDLPAAVRDRAHTAFGAAAARHLAQAARELGVDEAVSRYRRIVTALPPLADVPAVLAAARRVGDAAGEALRTAHLSAAIPAATALWTARLPLDEDLAALVQALAALGGTERAAAGCFAEVERTAHAARAPLIAAEAAKQLTAQARDEERLAAARTQLERGELEAARALFVAFLQEQPLHEGVQRELALVDQGLADLDRRLADVRLALRAGRLREACTGAMALVGASRIAAEAQQILAEARARMRLVDKGLDEVRVALHGRVAGSIEGVRHCLLRLEELAKVQVDHEELPEVIAAVQAELDALARCEDAAALLARAVPEPMHEHVAALLVARGELLVAERLDARLCALGDGMARCGDRALAAGRLAELQQWAELLRMLEPVRSDFALRAGDWQRGAERRRERASALLVEAKASLAERDLAAAEQHVEAALAAWAECSEARGLAEQLRRLREQTQTLEQVAALADERDFDAAQQKLAAIASVPPLLRTRVYDMKQDLARAQGLEGSFLLRVDEGGEQLVMRGETVTIGNVRQSRADLPVLANLAGRHASIRRSMTFHGGMQDTVVAEDGGVAVGDRSVAQHVLQAGDRVRLGTAFGFRYQRPTSRSLTCRLLLQSGFQVAGTDRVLLMKDRGRDGRILVGPGADVHVTVPGATGEVEIYANNAGQMRVRCEQGGTIDGVAFRGEHPVAAGQVVAAAGVSLVLLPWRPAA